MSRLEEEMIYMEFFCNGSTLPPGLPEEVLKKFLEESRNIYTPEEKLELSFILSGKCCAGGYIFPAPSLGTYLLLEEWKSPFLPAEGEKKQSICMQDLFLALFILENGKKASLELLKKRYDELFYRRNNPGRNFFPYRALEKIRKKYFHLEPVRTAEELLRIFSLHTAFDMLPDHIQPAVGTGEGSSLSFPEEKTYMEKVCDLMFLTGNILPAVSFDEILWQIPYVLLGYLFLRESRRAGLEGIGRMQTSERLWELFSRHIASYREKKEKTDEKKS